MFSEKALLAETFVEERQGQWIVYLEVIFEDETRIYEVGRYYTEPKAKIAAGYIRRVVNKDLPHPPNALGGCC